MRLAKAALPREFKAKVSGMTRMLRQAAAMRGALSAYYQTDDAGSRAMLPALFRHANVNSGLQSSNPALWRKLNRLYVKHDETLRAKERLSLDTTFYSYYLRTALKTSPHASFGPFIAGSWRASALPATAIALKGRQLERLVNIRHIVIADIVRPLLRDISNLEAFPFTLNETLRIEGGKITLRRLMDPPDPSAFVRNHQAAVVTLGANRPLQAIVAMYQNAPAQSHSLREIEQAVLDALPANLHRAVRTAVQALIAANVIEPDTFYDEFAEPFAWADQTLAKMPDQQAADVRARLAEARAALSRYATAPAAQRPPAMDRLRDRLSEAKRASGADLPAAVFDRILHEDCRLSGADAALSAATLGDVQPDLQCLVSVMPILERVARLQYWITDKFIGEFGEHGVCYKPEDFLTTIAQRMDNLFDAAGDQLSGYQALSNEIAKTEIAAALDILYARLMAHVEQAVATAAPVARLDRAYLISLAAAAPSPVRNCAISQCILGQLLNTRHQGARFVINHIYSGNGKMMSRFLDPADPDLPHVRSYLEGNCRDNALAEIPGLYGFNANIHPRLFDTEILVPPFTPRRRGVRQYRLNDLTLRVHQPTRRLQLVAPDGRGLEAFFLGAMAAPVLPPVIRMLDGLYAYGGPAFDLPLMLARRNAAPDRLIDIPRIQLGELILSRRTIFVPRAALPQSDLSDEAFYFAMQAWRRRLALPRKLFAKFPPSWFQPNVETTAEERARGKWKPLPIDFSAPLSVRLFRKALSGSSVGAVFTEAAPDFEDHQLWIDGKRYASELQFEITRRPYGRA